MAINLTAEQHVELEQLGTKPMQVIDPVNQKIYFVVSQEMFERVRGLFDQDPFDISETYRAQEAALAKVWDDPALDVYNNYDINPQRP
ncbi:MAG: hypothetical protein JWN70_6993 [Planctomycetaceae bacterium]|nr:hypothetical protein [Planctomycetaceae bacterium]